MNNTFVVVSIIDMFTRNQVCLGTQISPVHTITAAHCCKIRNTQIKTHCQSTYILNKNIHPLYNPFTLENDICLMTANTIHCPSQITTTHETLIDYTIKYENSIILPVQILNNQVCSNKWNQYFTTNQICATKPACFGSSGLPLFFNNKLKAIMSFGSTSCDDDIAVFTNVSKYTDWITQIQCRCLTSSECYSRSITDCGCINGQCKTESNCIYPTKTCDLNENLQNTHIYRPPQTNIKINYLNICEELSNSVYNPITQQASIFYTNGTEIRNWENINKNTYLQLKNFDLENGNNEIFSNFTLLYTSNVIFSVENISCSVVQNFHESLCCSINCQCLITKKWLQNYC